MTEEDAIAAFPKSVFNNVRTILGDNFDECAVNVQEELAQSLASFISGMICLIFQWFYTPDNSFLATLNSISV